MLTLFKNAKILTMKDDKILEGHVIIKDNLIQEVGKNVNLDQDFDEVIDCEGNLLMPGFKNAHTHSAMTFLRSIADDHSLEDWLFNEIFPRENNLYPGVIKELAKVAILEYLTSGITGCLDQYFYPQEFKETCEEMGFRSLSVLMYNEETRPYPEMKRLWKVFNDHEEDLAKAAIGMHAEYTSDKNMFEQNIRLLKETNSPFFTHLGETRVEVANCIASRGLPPLEYFDSLGMFNHGGAIFHGVYLSKKDIEILKKRNITVVTCPASNMKLASGIANIKLLLENNINVAIGTDGPASNNALDMFREMYLVTGLQKILHKNPISIPAFEILKMATVNGAKAMGLDNALYLAKGQLADIIMIDLARPSMQPINNIVSNLVYSGSKDVVKMTMINGKILYFNGEFRIKEKISDIYQRVQKLTDELKIIKEGSEAKLS